MRIKINGKDIDYGDHVAIETSETPTILALVIAAIGLAVIWWIATGGMAV